MSTPGQLARQEIARLLAARGWAVQMKTDPNVIRDLPDKVEIPVFCGLTSLQAQLYGQVVHGLESNMKETDGMQRRGHIFAALLHFKQICNHPAQYMGNRQYTPEQSAKFVRLRALCEPIKQRGERALVFTQFQEITAPLAAFLATIFGRDGLVLDGQTPMARRTRLVADFQREDGPPFMVLTLKVGGTGLNLTSANHVIHFDRWWNPAAEKQASDRAYRIGQTRNVMVHKFVCRGTLEQRIDELLRIKRCQEVSLSVNPETRSRRNSGVALLLRNRYTHGHECLGIESAPVIDSHPSLAVTKTFGVQRQ